MHAKKVVFISFQRTAQPHMQILRYVTWDVSFVLLDFWSDSRSLNVRLNQKQKAKKNRKTNASLGGHWFDWFSMISMIISNQLWLRLMKSFGSNLNGEWRAADGAKWVFVVNKPKNAELADGEFRGLTELTKWKGKKSKQVEVKSGKVNWIILGNCMWLMRNSLCGKSRLKCWIFIVFFQNLLAVLYIFQAWELCFCSIL